MRCYYGPIRINPIATLTLILTLPYPTLPYLNPTLILSYSPLTDVLPAIGRIPSIAIIHPWHQRTSTLL